MEGEKAYVEGPLLGRLTCINQKALKVLLCQPTCRRSTETSGKAFYPVGGLDFDTERPENIDAPRCSRGAVSVPSRHGCCNGAVYQPVTPFDLPFLVLRGLKINR